MIGEAQLENSLLVVFGDCREAGGKSFSEIIQPHPEETNFRPVQIEDLGKTAAIFLSSGSTGPVKAVCVSHRALLAQINIQWKIDDLDEDYLEEILATSVLPNTMLQFANMSWISSVMFLLGTSMAGYCRLITSKCDPERLWGVIEKYKPFQISMRPIDAMEWLKLRKPENIDVTFLRHVILIGCAANENCILALRAILPYANVCQSYGQTELTGVATLFKPLDRNHNRLLKQNPASSGLPIPSYSYKIVDLATKEAVGPCKWGELWLKSKYCNMNGYFGDTEATENSFDPEGWYKTGDMVYFDENFCFFIVDRIKDMFEYKKVLISPVMLQKEILNHEDVTQVVVIRVSGNDGHLPLALVVVDQESDVTERKIEQFLEEQKGLQEYKVRVRFVKDIPYLANGKIDRKAVYETVFEK